MGIFGRNYDFSGEQQKDSASEELRKAVQALQNSVVEIAQSVKMLHSQQQELGQAFGSIREEFGGIKLGGNSAEMSQRRADEFRSLSQYSDDELSALSESQKYQILEESNRRNFQKMVQEALNPISQELQGVQQLTARTKAETEIEKILNEKGPDGKALRPDFNDLLPIMVELKKDSAMKNLPLRNLYVLAKDQLRTSDPKKFEELEMRYNPPKRNLRQSYFGSLSNVSQESKPAGDMPIRKAAETAAMEVLESGGDLALEDGMN